MKVNVTDIKKLRQKTGAGIADSRRALDEAKGDFEKAEKLVRSWGIEKAESKSSRVAGAGLVETYVHNGRVGVMVEVNCETDFVARTDEFKNLAHEIAMQISAMNPKDVKDLLAQDYIRDSSKKVENLVKETIAKVGENIVIRRFSRYELGK